MTTYTMTAYHEFVGDPYMVGADEPSLEMVKLKLRVAGDDTDFSYKVSDWLPDSRHGVDLTKTKMMQLMAGSDDLLGAGERTWVVQVGWGAELNTAPFTEGNYPARITAEWGSIPDADAMTVFLAIGGSTDVGTYYIPIGGDMPLQVQSHAQQTIVQMLMEDGDQQAVGAGPFGPGEMFRYTEFATTTGQARDMLRGGDGDDEFGGGDGNDRLWGFGGDDRMYGGKGDDKMYGGKGDDDMDGGKGRDFIKGEKGADTLLGGGGDDELRGGGGADTLDGGKQRDILFGGAQDDILLGGKGKDMLVGDDGADILDGGRGDDDMEGGNGADEFRFHDRDGGDVIMDFELGVDRLVFDAALQGTLSVESDEFMTTVIYGTGGMNEVTMFNFEATLAELNVVFV